MRCCDGPGTDSYYFHTHSVAPAEVPVMALQSSPWRPFAHKAQVQWEADEAWGHKWSFASEWANSNGCPCLQAKILAIVKWTLAEEIRECLHFHKLEKTLEYLEPCRDEGNMPSAYKTDFHEKVTHFACVFLCRYGSGRQMLQGILQGGQRHQ